ncbi:hypothetical protein ACHAXA_004600 [Cyclostephanos tholiformis]|uniref:Uncharacterized protein n=1 Tax=Cyclostephanos tholiformis TaxID=382380 RepID=A0ABD3SPT4_9STRA
MDHILEFLASTVAPCVKCAYPGADVRILCPSHGGRGCAYHARCLDLEAIVASAAAVVEEGVGGREDCGRHDATTAVDAPPPPSSSCPVKRGRDACVIVDGTRDLIPVTTCPSCACHAGGLEILPLSFVEMDTVRERTVAAYAGCLGGVSALPPPTDDPVIAPPLGIADVPTAIPSHAGAHPRKRVVQCYDPSQPRTGRWTDEETRFRDSLISHFLEGNLPLGIGLKLNDFVPMMLKSKQSRLAKKMKHARLSTKYFHPKSGCLVDPSTAREFSRLERDFLSSVLDPVERSEVSFHMGREWREHLANRCHALRVSFDGSAWLSSVEDMERRLAFEKERHRQELRRLMMGRAMESDASDNARRGVFVDDVEDGGEGFDLLVEKSVSNSIQSNRAPGNSAAAHTSPYPSPFLGGYPHPSSAGGGCVGNAMGGLGRASRGEDSSTGCGGEPNLKLAAPFLSGIASYVERNGVPFEHIDVWVPSRVEDGGTAATIGSGDGGDVRLCYGGSMTLGVQIVNDSGSGTVGGDVGTDPGPVVKPSSGGGSSLRVPLSAEDKFNLSLFGLYSRKFSFKSGCGLPGRIFKSGIPAWEQYICHAPPELFERRGGAMQFGLKTAIGMPIDSPNVGRVVLVLYSKHDRSKDEGLVARMMCDLKLLCPAPRWKIVVDVDSHVGDCRQPSLPPPPALRAPLESRRPSSDNKDSAARGKERRVNDLLGLLASKIPPSEMIGPLGPHLQNIMALRLTLLRGNGRTPEEDQLVDTILVLYESYLHAGRKEADIVVMVSRDFAFHISQLGGSAMEFGSQQQASLSQGLSQVYHPSSMHSMASREAHTPATRGSSLMDPMLEIYARHQHRIRPSSPQRICSNPMINYNHAVNQQHHTPFYSQISGMSSSSISVSPKSDGSH